jgi:hypothetical protein
LIEINIATNFRSLKRLRHIAMSPEGNANASGPSNPPGNQAGE